MNNSQKRGSKSLAIKENGVNAEDTQWAYRMKEMESVAIDLRNNSVNLCINSTDFCMNHDFFA